MIEHLRIIVSRIFAVLLIALILVSSSALSRSAPLMGGLFSFIGLALVSVAVIGRMWCSLYIAGYKTDRLVDQGPYSISRNPLYFFSLVGAVGIGFSTETLVIPAIILICFLAYYPLVIRSEESGLLEIHGENFQKYMASVPRFFPAWKHLVEPEEYLVKPRIYRRHMNDVIWFLLILGFLELVKSLHQIEFLPTMLALY